MDLSSLKEARAPRAHGGSDCVLIKVRAQINRYNGLAGSCREIAMHPTLPLVATGTRARQLLHVFVVTAVTASGVDKDVSV